MYLLIVFVGSLDGVELMYRMEMTSIVFLKDAKGRQEYAKLILKT